MKRSTNTYISKIYSEIYWFLRFIHPDGEKIYGQCWICVGVYYTSALHQGGRGHGPVYYTSPQSLWINNLGDYNWILIGQFKKLIVQTFQQQIWIYRRGNFVFLHWGCILIHWQMSYPCRSMTVHAGGFIDIDIDRE